MNAQGKDSEYLSPIPERPTVIETLIKQILSLITEAGLKSGDRLPSEKAIIAATKASRPSVREALRALKTMGIIETRPGAGSFLRHLEPADAIQPEVVRMALANADSDNIAVKDIVQARQALECEVVRCIARQGCRRIPAAEHLVHQMAQFAEAGKDIYRLAWGFHLAIVEQAGNPIIRKLICILYEMIREFQLETYWRNIDLREEAKHHLELYQAIVSGDEECALAAMRTHLDRISTVAFGSSAQDTCREDGPRQGNG